MAINRRLSKLRVSRLHMVVFVVIGLVVVLVAVKALRFLRSPVIDLKESEKELLYIPTGSTLDDVVGLLNLKGWLSDEETFRQMAGLMNYEDHVHAGRYTLRNKMSARDAVQLLRSGQQTPVNMTFNNVRTLDRLASLCSRNLEVDSAMLMQVLLDDSLTSRLGFTQATLPAMFIPNTYQLNWNTSPSDWLTRMHKEYNAFWTEARLHKADSIGLTPTEVSTLASIIEEETNKADELPIIAGIYLNRLRIGMPMQACPTLKYAMGDFTVRRILKRDEEIESPYNTYKYRGLPPGPIRIPSIAAIDAVLNAADHKYLFMCASADGSGRHRFATTNAEHQRNAQEYQRELNRRKIYR